MAEIQKGKISTIETEPVDEWNHPTTARVFALTGGSVTRPLIIPWWLRGSMGNLKPGDEVVYIIFEDMTGWILGRFDGNFQHYVPYDVILDGFVKVTNYADVTNNVSGADFISAEYGSTNNHTHKYVKPAHPGGSDDTEKPTS